MKTKEQLIKLFGVISHHMDPDFFLDSLSL